MMQRLAATISLDEKAYLSGHSFLTPEAASDKGAEAAAKVIKILPGATILFKTMEALCGHAKKRDASRSLLELRLKRVHFVQALPLCEEQRTCVMGIQVELREGESRLLRVLAPGDCQQSTAIMMAELMGSEHAPSSVPEGAPAEKRSEFEAATYTSYCCPLGGTPGRMITNVEFYNFMLSQCYAFSGPFLSVKAVNIFLQSPDSAALVRGECLLAGTSRFDVLLDGAWQAMVYAVLSQGGNKNSTHDDQEPLLPVYIASISCKTVEEFISNAESQTESAAADWLVCFSVDVKEGRGDCSILHRTNNGLESVVEVEDVMFRRGKLSNCLSTAKQFVQQTIPSSSPPPPTECQLSILERKTLTQERKIGIRAMACRLPGSLNSPEVFFQFLLDGGTTDIRIPSTRIHARNHLIKEGVLEGGHFITGDVADFDAAFFGISRMEAEGMDPQQRLLLEVTYECMERANLKDFGESTGIFIGCMGSEYPDACRGSSNPLYTPMLGSSSSLLAGRLSHHFNCKGPSISIDTACSSSLVALDLACQAIKAGRCRRALVGGVSLILAESGLRQRVMGKMLAYDGVSKSFDADADGYGRADGCVVMLLEEVGAENPCFYEAIIEASNVNHDGRSISLTAPSAASQERLIADCLTSIQDSHFSAESLVFWECHSTGTALGDPIEYAAFERAIMSTLAARRTEPEKEEYERASDNAPVIYLGSAKASVGHCEAASGLVGLMKAVKQLEHMRMPPLANFHRLNSQIKARAKEESPRLALAVEKVELAVRTSRSESVESEQVFGGVSSFGISGTNACAVLSRNISQSRTTHLKVKLASRQNPPHLLHILPIAAKSQHSLDAAISGYLMLVEDNTAGNTEGLSLEWICAAAALNRRHFAQCRAVVHFSKLDSDEGRNTPRVLRQASDLSGREERDAGWGQLAKRELRLARAYLSGAEVNWAGELGCSDDPTLFSSILLPSYTFERKPFWVIPRAEHHDFDHPIIGYVVKCGEDDNSKIQFENLLSPRRMPLMAEVVLLHHGSKKKLLPIGVCIEGLIAAAAFFYDRHQFGGNGARSNGNLQLSIEGIQIDRLDVLDERGEAWLITTVRKAETHTGAEEISLENALTLQVYLATPIHDSFLTARVLCRTTTASNTPITDIKCDHRPWRSTAHRKLDGSLVPEYSTNTNGVYYGGGGMATEVSIEFDEASGTTRISTTDLSRYEPRRFPFTPYVVNPLLLEAIVQILQHQGILVDYTHFGKLVRRMELYVDRPLHNVCWVRHCNNIIELLDQEQKLAAPMELELPPAKIAIEEGGEIGAHKLPVPEELDDSNRSVARKDKEVEGLRISIPQTGSSIPEKLDCARPKHREAIVSELLQFLEDSLPPMSIGLRERNELIHTKFENFDELDSLGRIQLQHKVNAFIRQKQLNGETSSSEAFSRLSIHRLTELIIGEECSGDGGRISSQPQNGMGARTSSKHVVLELSHCYKIHRSPIQHFSDAAAGRSVATTNKEKNYIRLVVRSSHVEVRSVSWQNEHHQWECIANGELEQSLQGVLLNFFSISAANSNGKEMAISLSIGADCTMELEAACRLLLHLGRGLLHVATELRAKVTLRIVNEPLSQSNMLAEICALKGLAEGFFRSLAVEYPTEVRLCNKVHFERIPKLELTSNCSDSSPFKGAWIILGGTSGIGLEMGRFLLHQCHIPLLILVSRRGPPLEGPRVLGLHPVQGAQAVEIYKADVSERSQLEDLFEDILAQLPHFRTNSSLADSLAIQGVVHSAGVLKDALFEQQTEDSFLEVAKAKCLGLKHLSECLKKYRITPQFLVVNSSISSLLGNQGQTNYSAANAYVDAYVRAMNAALSLESANDGKRTRAISVNWGNWLGCGLADRAGVNPLLEKRGFTGLSAEEAMSYFHWLLCHSPTWEDGLCVAKLDWTRLLQQRSDLVGVLLGEKLGDGVEEGHAPTTSLNSATAIEQAKETSVADVYRGAPTRLEISAAIEKSIAFLLPADNPSPRHFDHESGLMELGLDSLKLFTLADELNRRLDETLPQHAKMSREISVLDLFEHSSIGALCAFIEGVVSSPAVSLQGGSISAMPAAAPALSPSCASTRVKSLEVRDDEVDLLREHLIGEEAVCPAAFQLHRLGGASQALECFALDSLRFERPLPLSDLLVPEGIEITTHISITVEKNELASMELRSPGEGMAYSRCNVVPADEGPNPATDQSLDDVEELLDTVEMKTGDFYARLSKGGLRYGKALQLLTHIKRTAKIVPVTVEQGGGKSTMRRYAYATTSMHAEVIYQHPWLLYEAALQTLSAALIDFEEENENCYWLPVKIRHVRIRKKLLTRPSQVRIVGRADISNSGVAKGDAWIQADGEEFFRMEEVEAVRRLPGAKPEGGVAVKLQGKVALAPKSVVRERQGSQKWCSGPSLEWPKEATIIEALRGQCSRLPENLAIIPPRAPWGESPITYGQLWERIRASAEKVKLAYAKVRGRPPQPGDVIPICADNNAAVLWLLTVLECGCAYAIIDSQTPLGRMEEMLADLRSSFMIATKELKSSWPQGVTVFDTNTPSSGGDTAAEDKDGEALLATNACRATSKDLAYLAFTSGSTGKQKMVCVEHRNVMAFIHGATLQLGLHFHARLGHAANCTFDVSIFNIFGALLNGGCLIQAPQLLSVPFRRLPSSLLPQGRKTFTHLSISTALFNSMPKEDLATLWANDGVKHLIVGGETPCTASIALCLEKGLVITQTYGPTETTVWSTLHTYQRGDDYSGSIVGLPCPNQSVCLLPTAIEPGYRTESIGEEVGELCISGSGVARGYLPSTSHVEIDHYDRSLESSSSSSLYYTAVQAVELGLGERICYRTGDLMWRRLSGGPYHFIGRLDQQLKVRGIRIDALEVRRAIEQELNNAGISAYPHVMLHERDSNSVVSKEDMVANKPEEELVAYIPILSKKEYQLFGAIVQQLRAGLMRRLPTHMIPSHFFPIQEPMPLNTSGKVDTRRLLELISPSAGHTVSHQGS